MTLGIRDDIDTTHKSHGLSSFFTGLGQKLSASRDRVKPCGRSGRLPNFLRVILAARLAPFVWWRDISHHSSESGIGWPRIGPVDGRTGDVIALPSGRKIPMPGLTLVMRWMDGLKSYQFIQTGANAITVRLERDPTFVLDDAGVLDFLRQRIGVDIEWQIVWAGPELTRNGKLLIIRNDWLRG